MNEIQTVMLVNILMGKLEEEEQTIKTLCKEITKLRKKSGGKKK